jgi:hypothetical protein
MQPDTLVDVNSLIKDEPQSVDVNSLISDGQKKNPSQNGSGQSASSSNGRSGLLSGKRPAGYELPKNGFAANINLGGTTNTAQPEPETPQENPSRFLNTDMMASGKGIDPNFDTGLQLAAYHNERNKQLDNEKNILRTQILNHYQDKNVQQGDIATGIRKLPVKPLVPETEPSVVQNLHTGINDINDYQNKLNNSIKHVASVYVGTKTKDPVEAGRMVRTILGDKNAAKEQVYQEKELPIAPAQQFYNEREGIDALQTSLDERYQDKSDPEYLKEKADLDLKSKSLINKYPEFRDAQIAKALVQQILKDHPNASSAMMLPYGAEAAKKLGLTKEEWQNIDFDNLPFQNVAGTALGVVYNSVLNMGAGAARIGSGIFGIDKDKTDAYLNQALQRGQQRFEDVEGLQNAPTIVDTDKASKTYLQDIANPDKGKYNYNFHTISNSIAGGIANLASIVGETKLLGGVAKGFAPSIAPATEADLGMAATMIGQGYEPYYQQARTVVSDKPQDEWKRHLYAFLNGSLDYLAFKPLTKLQEIVSPSQAKELGTILNGASSLEEVSKTKLKNWTTKVLEGVGNTLKETGVVGGSTTIADVGKNVIDNILGTPDAAKQSDRELGGKVTDNLSSLFFTMAIPLGLGELTKGIQHSFSFKENLYNAGLNPKTYAGKANELLQNGTINQDQFNKRMQVINTVSDVVNSIPEDLNLNHNQKVAYVNSKMKELALQAKADKIKDPALEQYYKQKIQDEVNNRINTINGADKSLPYENNSSQLNSENNASTQSSQSQQTGDEQSSQSEHARTEQAGSETTLTGSESSNSNLGSEGQEKVSSVGLSHGDWLDRNRDLFPEEKYNQLNHDLNSDNEVKRQYAIDEIVAKKKEVNSQNIYQRAKDKLKSQQSESEKAVSDLPLSDQLKLVRTQLSKGDAGVVSDALSGNDKNAHDRAISLLAALKDGKGETETSLEDRLKAAKEDLPQIDNESNVSKVSKANDRAKDLLAQLKGEKPGEDLAAKEEPAKEEPQPVKNAYQRAKEKLQQQGKVEQPQNNLINRAKYLVNSGVVKGFTADILKESAHNNLTEFKQHLKDISEQANDPKSNKATVDTYGKELVDIAQKLNPIVTEPASSPVISDSKEEPKDEAINTTDYRGEHQIVNPITTADNLEGGGSGFEWKYSAQDWEGQHYKESLSKLKSIKDNPDAEVTIYRAVPKGVKEINNGDWISLSKTYAKEHGMHETDSSKDMPVISKKVKAKDIGWDGNDLNEFVYNPKDTQSGTKEQPKETSIPGKGQNENPLKDVESTTKVLQDISDKSIKPSKMTSDEFRNKMNDYEAKGMSKEDAFTKTLDEERERSQTKDPIKNILSDAKSQTISIPSPDGHVLLPKVLIRFGEPVKNEKGEYQKSGVYINGELKDNEKGISVYEAGYDPKTKKYILPNDELSNATQGSLLIGKGRDVFIVKGKELKDVGSDGEVLIEPKTYEAISKISKNDIKGDISGDYDESIKYWETNDSEKLAYLYHKAKADGSNPELVKAVEDLIGSKQTNNTENNPEPTNKVESSSPVISDKGVAEKSPLKNIESFETSKGSVYKVLPDGRTQRFKTKTGELKEPQDLTSFVKFEGQDEDNYLQAIHGYNGESVHIVGLVDGKVTELKTNEEAKNATNHKLVILDKDGKIVDKIDALLSPKEGYNVFDQRQIDKKGNGTFEKHIGNTVSKITEKTPKEQSSSKPTNKDNEHITPKEQTPEGNTGESGDNKGKENNEKPVTILKQRAKPQIKSPLYRKALDVQDDSPNTQVLKYFISGGKISDSALKEFFGDKRGEINAKIQLRGKDAPKTIDALAHYFWDSKENRDRYTTEDFREAIESVLQNHNSRTSMAKELANAADLADPEKQMQEFYDKHYGEAEKEGVDEDAFNEAIDRVEQMPDKDIQKEVDLNEAVQSAQKKYDKAQSDLKKAEDEYAKEQAKQGDIFDAGKNVVQKNLFANNRDAIKNSLDPLRQAVREAKSDLTEAQKNLDLFDAQFNDKNLFDILQTKVGADDPLKEEKEIIKSIIQEGVDNNKDVLLKDILKDAKEAGADVDKVEQAYHELGRETTIEPNNELSKGISKRINTFISKLFGKNDNYISVKSPEELQEIAKGGKGVKFMRNEEGKILGLTKDGQIYLNKDALNPNTPVHEAGHIWTEWAKENNKPVYQRGIDLVNGSRYFKQVSDNKFYQKEASKLGKKGSPEYNEYLQHEALAKAIGDKGAQFVTETKRNSFASWAKNLFDSIAKKLGLKGVTANELQNMTLDEFSSRAARDILAGEPAKAEPIKPEPKEPENKEEPPPPPTEEENVKAGDNLNEWSRINLKSLLPKVRDMFRKVNIAWDDRAKSAMENLAKEAQPGETLVHAATTRLDNFYKELSDNKKIRFNSEDQTVMHFLHIATQQEMAKAGESAQKDNTFTSINSIASQVLDEQFNRVNAVLGAMRSEGGVILGAGITEARLHPDYGFEVRQMQMIKANKGEPLNEETEQFLKDQWEKEKELNKQEQEVREQGLKADFDKRIAELQRQHEAKLKELGAKPKTVKEKTSSKLRDFAKGLRTSDEFDKFIKNAGNNDVTRAGFSIDINLKEAVANAAEHIADLLDKGEKIADAIKDAARKFKGDLDEADFSKILNNFYTKASLPDKEVALQSIKDLAAKGGDTEITTDMVEGNHIRDYVNSFIGDVDQKDLLNEAAKGLKEILPDVTKKQLIEAYLKEGDYKPQTKEELKNGVAEAKKQLVSIAKLEEDIEDLNNLRGVRQRLFPTEREKSDYEQKLYDEKQAKLKEISDRAAKIREDNNRIEKERDRQLKVIQDLNEKKAELEKGIRRKTEKNPSKEDTPEIEDLKKQVQKVSDDLRKAETEKRKIEREAQNKKDKLGELNANIERAKNDRDLIKTYRGKTDREVDAEIAAKQKELKEFTKSNTSDERIQKQLLEKAKKDAMRKRDDLQQKLDKLKETGELEGAIKESPKTLKKEDAELINIRRQLAQVQSAYREKQNKLREKEMSVPYKLADVGRSLWVDYLIGSPKTLAKIAWMGFIKPATDVGRRMAFGKLFHLFSPEISSAAKRGGESSSWRTIQSMAKVYFRQLGEKGLQKMYEKGEKNYYDAYAKYIDYANSDKPEKKVLADLKKDMDNKMFITLGNFMHQFVGGSSIKDAYDSFIHRVNYIEKQFGDIHEESLAKATEYNPELSNRRNLLNAELGEFSYIANFVGRSHAALKSFSARASFAAGFMARIEADIEAGKKVDGTRLLEIGNESYIDWERGKYQQGNMMSNSWNNVLRSEWTDNPKWHEYEKYLKQFLRGDIAVTRVPVNILYEEAMEFGAGAFRAVHFAQREYNKAFKQAIEEGYAKKADDDLTKDFLSKEFQDRVKEIVRDMDGDMAAKIARNFQKGGIGIGLYTLAILWGGVHFGIFPHKGQTKKKDEDELKPDELNPGQVMFGNTKMGETTSAAIEHTPALWPLFMGLGMAQQYHNDIKKGKMTVAAAKDATWVHLQIIEGQIPFGSAFSPLEFIKESVGRQVRKTTDSMGLTDPVDTKGGLPKTSIGRKYLEDNNINLPELDNTKVKINIDSKHPEGKMTQDEFSIFKDLRSKILDSELSNLAASDVGQKLTKEQKKEAAIKAESQATTQAKKEMIKAGYFSEKEPKTREEKRINEEIKRLFKKGSGGGGGANSKFSIRNLK